MTSSYTFHTYDLPSDLVWGSEVAIDTETMGLQLHRDRLCLVQIYDPLSGGHLVHFPTPVFDCSPNLCAFLTRLDVLKIFHFARFDVAVLQHSLNIRIQSVYCTKIVSKLTRTYTDRHGLKDLCKEILKIELPKEEQTSDWGACVLSEKQKDYAFRDVIYLHALKKELDERLRREERTSLARACFDFLPFRCDLDYLAGENFDIFAHKS